MRDAIRLLGSFQPSNSLMLKFYAYYKQVTTGSCDVPRPAFYDVIGKAKW
jgi:acyl-CoA-binding protein